MPRKSWIEGAAEAVAKAATPVVQAVKAAVGLSPTGDPWYRDDVRRKAINARGDRLRAQRSADLQDARDAAMGKRRWFRRRRGWLR